MILSFVIFTIFLLPTSRTIQDFTHSRYDRDEIIDQHLAQKYQQAVMQMVRHPLGEGDYSREQPEQFNTGQTPVINHDYYDEGIVRLGSTTTTTTTKRTTRTTTTGKTTEHPVYRPNANVHIENAHHTPLPFPPNPISDEVMLATLAKEKGLVKKHKSHRKGKKHEATTSKAEFDISSTAIDVFYRRLTEDRTRNLPLRWVHCQDMITPHLTGAYSELRESPSVGPNDRTVVRLIKLMNLNTSTLTSEELTGVLHQINQISIRLFNWETKAIRVLLAAICKGRKHSFHGIKHGIIRLFDKWRLNIKNVSSLLTNAKMYYPPCVNSIAFEGSTKSSKQTTYTTLDEETTTSSTCDDDDDSDEEERR